MVVADMMRAAQAAVSDLQTNNEEELYRLLAVRLEAIGRDPSHAGQFAPTVHPAELGIAPLDLLKAGKAAFVRVADAAQPIICGSGASQGLQLQQLLGAFSTNLTTITAAVAGLLITQLAIAPAIACVGAFPVSWRSRSPLCLHRDLARRLPGASAGQSSA